MSSIVIIVLSYSSLTLSLTHTHAHSGEEVKMKLLLGPKWWCIIATVVEIHLWMLAKKFSMHVTFWFHQCCVPLSNYYLWWWLWNWPQWGVGVTRQFLLEEGFWENGVQQGNVIVVDAWVVLSSPKEGISVPRTLGKCSLRYYSLNDDGSVTKDWLVSSLSRWQCRCYFATNASLRGRDMSCESETGGTTGLHRHGKLTRTNWH